MRLTVNSEPSLSRAIGELREAYKADRFLTLTVKRGKPRSLSQNDISHAWYEQLATELRERDALGFKCEAKLLCGVPILRAEDADFRAFYDASLKWRAYEEKVEAMKFVPVTSLMTTKQLTAYLEAMQSTYAKRGVVLAFPETAHA